MKRNPKKDLIQWLYKMPIDIAHKLGYEKLTPLHNLWIRQMVFGSGDQTIQGHRGSFKTTCLIIALSLIIVLMPEKRTIFLRKTDTDVVEVMRGVSSILRNPYFVAMAMDLYGTTFEIITDTHSELSTNIKQGASSASQLLSIGCGGSLTGKHADFIFTDDIVNVKDRVSNAERERTKLIYMELQNIKNRGGRIINTGTPWHKEDAFVLMPNIEKFDCYSTGLMTDQEIDHVRNSMSRSLFSANYELKHIADEDAIFTDPQFFTDESILYDGIAHVDAAYGGGDFTALTIAKEVKGTFYVYGKMWPKAVDDVLPEILATVKALRAGTIYCEKNSDKGYLRKEILQRGHPCRTYTEHTNKYIKIVTYLKGEWANVRFLENQRLDPGYINQILDYNENAAHDDAPDSLASIIRQLENHSSMQLFKESL